MGIRITGFESNVTNNQKINALMNMSGTSMYLKENKAVFEFLSAEGRDDFVYYIQALSLD